MPPQSLASGQETSPREAQICPYPGPQAHIWPEDARQPIDQLPPSSPGTVQFGSRGVWDSLQGVAKNAAAPHLKDAAETSHKTLSCKGTW